MTEETFLLEHISPLELFGVNNSRFRQIKEHFPELVFVARGNELKLRGPEEDVLRARSVLELIIREIQTRGSISEERYSEILSPEVEVVIRDGGEEEDGLLHGSRGRVIRARTEGQRKLIEAINANDVVFAVGPAGTGKTYVAVAMAVKALREKKVRKIFLVRPAVEAGEQLGFLPGDLKEKVDPYLRPLYDALEDMVHFDKMKVYLEKNIIEVAPLAYMRGRTLSEAFVILDEAQNATEMQFKMILTRLGQGSKIVVTGDDTQVDLPPKIRSGLPQALRVLRDVEGIGIVRMKVSDVVRHKMVKKIIAAYRTEEPTQEKPERIDRPEKPENPA
jgi:phosphate starvation-inducible PhoH-like protein